jgi:hypothetical protein
MATYRLALCTLALNILLATQAHALNADRFMNLPININPGNDHAPLSGHNGFSLDVELSRGNSTSWTSPNSTSHETTVLRYTFVFGAPERRSRECSLSWAQHARVAATSVVFALSNRLLRGEDDIGGQLPGGATLWGNIVPWMVAASIHDGLTYGQATGHIAADFAAEQLGGWGAELDMGQSSKLPSTHWAYNPGDRFQDQIDMTAKLYRAKSLSMAMMHQRYGELDATAIAAPVIGGLGYQAGRYWYDTGDAPGQDEKGVMGQLIGGQAYHLGEVAFGGAYGLGIGRSVECYR